MESLHGLTEWKRLGLALGLFYPTLESIEKDCDRNDDCKMKMLAAWLRQQDSVSQKGVPSWSVLQAALRRVGENELASRIVVSCKYNIVMVCTVNKWSLSQEGELEEDKVGERRRRRGEERYKEEEEERIAVSFESNGSVRQRRNTSADGDGDTATGMTDAPFLSPSSHSLAHSLISHSPS